MRELVEGKNAIGRTAAVLKKPYKATFTFYLSECVFVASVVQHIKSMHIIIIIIIIIITLQVAYPPLPYFPNYLTNGRFSGKKLLNTKCVF